MSGSRAERLCVYHGCWKKRLKANAKERKKPEYPRVSAVPKWWLWREDWKEKRKKWKFSHVFLLFEGFMKDFGSGAETSSSEGLWCFWLPPEWSVGMSVSICYAAAGSGRREGKKKCIKEGKKKGKKERIKMVATLEWLYLQLYKRDRIMKERNII